MLVEMELLRLAGLLDHDTLWALTGSLSRTPQKGFKQGSDKIQYLLSAYSLQGAGMGRSVVNRTEC